MFDYLVLVGDTSDNIPGVENIGPKTAIKLLNDFETLEGIFQNIDKLKGKIKENLIKDKTLITLNPELVEKKEPPIITKRIIKIFIQTKN